MKKLSFTAVLILGIALSSQAQLILNTQFINPCGGDEHNEFIVAKTGTNAVNLANVAFGSYNPSSNSNGIGGTPEVNYNYWWRGNSAASSPYPVFSAFAGESCEDGVGCYGFRYPSIAADNADINSLITTLNTIAGCTVFLPVPVTDILPANSNIIFFLGAGYRNSTALCGFDNAALNMNFNNHCNGGVPLATYYAVFGTGSGAGPNCTNTGGGYFSNSSRRISALHTFNGTGDSANAASYTSSYQDYDPGAGASTGNAGIILPTGTGGTTWINNQGCVPPPAIILAVRFEYFTGVLSGKKAMLKWKTSLEENISAFVLEKSLNGKDFTTLQQFNPNNISGSEYNGIDETLASGNNFYRLKVINLDGTIDRSNIVKIQFTKGAPANWFVYPNPVETREVTLMYQSTTRQNIAMRLTDIAGKLISSSKYAIVPGNNRLQIDAGRLGAGVYLVSIVSQGIQTTASFLKK